MKILCTGGAGYLGSVLVPMLLEANYDVTVLDSFRRGAPSLAAWCFNPRLNLVYGDVQSPITQQLASKADVIIPLAALAGAPECDRDPIGAIATNTKAVEALCSKASFNQLILFPNTNSGYGIGDVKECTEDSPLRPVSLYGRSKIQAEAAVLQHPNGVSFRFATLFGASPRMRLDLLVNDFVYRAVRDRALTLFEGGFRRNYLHVRDAASAFLFLLSNPMHLANHRVFNCGDSRANMNKRELCVKIQQHVPNLPGTRR